MHPVTAHSQSLSVRLPRAGACTHGQARSHAGRCQCKLAPRSTDSSNSVKTPRSVPLVPREHGLRTPYTGHGTQGGAFRRVLQASGPRPTASVSSPARLGRLALHLPPYVIPRPESPTLLESSPRHPLLAATIFAPSSQVCAPPAWRCSQLCGRRQQLVHRAILMPYIFMLYIGTSTYVNTDRPRRTVTSCSPPLTYNRPGPLPHSGSDVRPPLRTSYPFLTRSVSLSLAKSHSPPSDLPSPCA